MGLEFDAQVILVRDIGGHADFLLGVAIPALQMFVLDRPVDEAVESRPHLKIAGQKAQACSQPVAYSAPVDALVGAAERQWTLLDEIALLGILPIAEFVLTI